MLNKSLCSPFMNSLFRRLVGLGDPMRSRSSLPLLAMSSFIFSATFASCTSSTEEDFAIQMQETAEQNQALVVWGEEEVSSDEVSGCASASADFGASLAITADTLIVGAPSACVPGSSDVAAGAVAVFDREANAWLGGDVIRRANVTSDDAFGAALAYSSPTLVVGAPNANLESAGAAGVLEVFVRAGWRFQGIATLVPPFGAPSTSENSGFGSILAIADDLILAGVPRSSPSGEIDAGSVYVYSLAGATWQSSQILRDEFPTAGTRFGLAVATDASWAAIASQQGVQLYRRGELSLLPAERLDESDVVDLVFSGVRLALARTDGTVAVYLRNLNDAWELEEILEVGDAGSRHLAWQGNDLVLASAAKVTTHVATGTLSATGEANWIAGGDVAGVAPGVASIAVHAGQIAAGSNGTVSTFRRVASDGEVCGNGDSCLSGFCVDGVCCESLCGGGENDCLACSIAAGSSTDGLCEIAAPGTICRLASGGCDDDEICNGLSSSCPIDTLKSAGTTCRAAAGSCDQEENCDGSSAFCPADDFVNVGTLCRAPVGICDLPESCDGLRPQCPSDATKQAGTQCRARFGECDVAESCDGTEPICPPDGFVAFGTICRPATSQCDADEVCSGLAADCPLNAFAVDGTQCIDGDLCTEGDSCLQGRCISGDTVCDDAPSDEPEETPFDPAPEPTLEDAGTAVMPEDTPDAGTTDPIDEGCSCSSSTSNSLGSVFLLGLGFVLLTAPRRRRHGLPRAKSGQGSGSIAGLFSALVLVAFMAPASLAQDVDNDGVLDVDDRCFGDDSIDSDNDGTPDACDCQPNDPTRARDLADICDGIDNNCDGRVDEEVLLQMGPYEMARQLSTGEASGSENYNISIKYNNPTSLAFEPRFPRSNFQVLFQRPVSLRTHQGHRVVDVVLRRETLLNRDSDTQIAFSDGTRAVGAGIFNANAVELFMGAGITGVVANSVMTELDAVGGGGYPRFRDRFPVGEYHFRIDAREGETTIVIQGPGSILEDRPLTLPPIVVTGELALDPNVPWDFLIPANSQDEKYYFVEVEVTQPFPATSGAADLDDDGFEDLCDCDDLNPAIHPFAKEVCDGFNSDCRASRLDEKDAIMQATGAKMVQEVQDRIAQTYPSWSLQEEGLAARLSGGEMRDIAFRRRIGRTLNTELERITLDFEVNLSADSVAKPLNIGIGGGGGEYIYGFQLERTSTTTARMYAFNALDFYDEIKAVGIYSNSAVDFELASTEPFRFTVEFCREFLTDCISRGRIETANGTSDWTPFPSLFGPNTPLELIVVPMSSQDLVLNSIGIAEPPADADADGICDRLDACAGFDGTIDADGDGVLNRCDCDDGNRLVYPGAAEICDGIDQDCDGQGDLFKIAGGRGTELLHNVTKGIATMTGVSVSTIDANTIQIVGAPSSPYREPIPSQLAEDGSVQFAMRLDGDNIVARIHDGAAYFEFAFINDKFRVHHGLTNADGIALSVSTTTSSDVGPNEEVVVSFSADEQGRRIRLDRPFTITDGNPHGLSVFGQTIELPNTVGPDFRQDMQLMLFQWYGPPSLAIVRDMTLSTSLADADFDQVCNEQDLCTGFDDGEDGDGDGIPDGCDLCFGPDGASDFDQDGYPSGCDCNDLDAEIHPGQTDVCNAVDDDCGGGIDVHTAYSLRGSELVTRLVSDQASGANLRPTTSLLGGAVVEIGTSLSNSINDDIYFRAPIELLPGTEGRFSMVFDREPITEDSDFFIGVSDGTQFFGVGLYDQGGTGTTYTPLAQVAQDLGDRLAEIERGIPTDIAEASPYHLEFFIADEDPRIILTSAAGIKVVLRPDEASDLSGFGSSLDLVLVTQKPWQRQRFRSVVIEQPLVDSDEDGVCNAIDVCQGQDDLGEDTDADGIADVCDICPLGDDRIDDDNDGVPNACDLCENADDGFDRDQDGIPDGCDACPDDYANDNDGDEVCDLSDLCLGGDDRLDFDDDGIPDACDPCPLDVLDDQDEDRICDTQDICLGNDASGDQDGDGYCADLDCDDTRAHIFPGAVEICDGFDSDCNGALREDELDSDGDGVIDCRFVPIDVPTEPEPTPAPDATLDPGESTTCGCTQAKTQTSQPQGSLLWLLGGLFGLHFRKKGRFLKR